MNILLTGASGFIGSYLLDELSQNYHVFALTRTDAPTNKNNITWLKMDFSMPNDKAILPENIDIIIHLAQSKFYREFPEKARDIFNVNINSVLTLLEYARRIKIKKFIFASSATVYKYDNKRISESVIPEPFSPYGRSKRIAEMLIESYAGFFQCIVLRLFTVYGRRQTDALIPSIISRIKQGNLIQVQGKAGLKLTPIYVTDVVKIIQETMVFNEKENGLSVFNVGGDEITSVYELSCFIGNELGIPPKFDFLGGGDEGGLMANNAKIKSSFNINQFISLEDGIKKTLKQF